MIFTKQKIQEVILISPNKIIDSRGFFSEIFRLKSFEEFIGKKINFVQENESYSFKNVLRGLHFQQPPFSQSKLIRVLEGEIIDFAVDIRKNSLTFSQHVAVNLSKENYNQLFVPRGFAHGFFVLSDYAIVNYKVDNYFSSKHDGGINFFDRSLGISEEISKYKYILSEKDKSLVNIDNLYN